MEITKRYLYSEIKKDDGLDKDCDIKKTLPGLLGAFILSNSKRIMNIFIEKKTDFLIEVYTTETPIA